MVSSSLQRPAAFGQVWGYAPARGVVAAGSGGSWTLLYQLPLGPRASGAFSAQNGSWVTAGGTYVTDGCGQAGPPPPLPCPAVSPPPCGPAE